MRSVEQLMDDFLTCTDWFDLNGNATGKCPGECKIVIESQKKQFEKDNSSFEKEGFILSGLWNGDFVNAPLLVLSSNPAIRTKECSPRYFPADKKFYQPVNGNVKGIEIGSGIEARNFLIDFSNRVFADRNLTVSGKDPKVLNMTWYEEKTHNAVPFWGCMRNAVETLLPEELRQVKNGNAEDYMRFLMSFVLSTEIVPFQSNSETGVAEAMNYCWDKFTKDLVSLSNAPVVLLIGKKVLEYFGKNVFEENDNASIEKLREGAHIELLLGGKKRIIVYRKFSQGTFARLVKQQKDSTSVDLQDETLTIMKDALRKTPLVQSLLKA